MKLTIIPRANEPSRLSRIINDIAASDGLLYFPRFSSPVKIDQNRFLFFAFFQHDVCHPKVAMDHLLVLQAFEDVLQSFQENVSAVFFDAIRMPIYTIIK
jgi:hypothetical protein